MKTAIVGSGGHAGVVMDAASLLGIQFDGIIDDTLEAGSRIGLIEVLGGTSENYADYSVFIAIGNNESRRRICESIKVGGFMPAIIHPSANVATSAMIGRGVFIAAGANIGNKSSVGLMSIVNTHANLDHDSSIGMFSHLAPNSSTGGRVTIMDECLIGIGASIRDGISIGSRTTIGMGSVVTKSIIGGTNFGNPCKSATTT